MTRETPIIELGAWLTTPPGQRLLAWEQDRFDHAVADAFGFHALQLGLPEIGGLRANRMPHRWVASDSLQVSEPPPAPAPLDGISTSTLGQAPVQLHGDFDALPFPNACIDLVVMPHTLELSRDPHLTLREVERVLVPEGRLLVAGLNPVSLWALGQRGGRAWRRIGLGRGSAPFLPRAGEFIGYWRLRDWLRLLGFEVEAGRFGCYQPPCRTEKWLQRWNWMDRLGDRWWPVLGSVYFLSAVKHVRGMRLVGLAKRDLRRVPNAAPVVAPQRCEPAESETA